MTKEVYYRQDKENDQSATFYRLKDFDTDIAMDTNGQFVESDLSKLVLLKNKDLKDMMQSGLLTAFKTWHHKPESVHLPDLLKALGYDGVSIKGNSEVLMLKENLPSYYTLTEKEALRKANLT